jgi:3-methyladenine DNA glycosylase AlkC
MVFDLNQQVACTMQALQWPKKWEKRRSLRAHGGSRKKEQIVNWLESDRHKLLTSILRQLNLNDSLDLDSLWTDEFQTQTGPMQSFAIGNCLAHRIKIGDEAWRFLATHANEIVREWSAIIVGLTDSIAFARKLAWMKPFADDEHEGLREIAWLALRPDVVRNPLSAVRCLVPWTGSRNERLRRFAVEITRPCGVECAPVHVFQDQPELGLPILDPLSSDDSVYVQISVGNWLKDASKSKPEWVQATTERWLSESASTNTQAIVKHAMSTI